MAIHKKIKKVAKSIVRNRIRPAISKFKHTRKYGKTTGKG